MRSRASALSPVLALLLPAFAFAEEDRPRVKAQVIRPTKFGVSCPVRDLTPWRKAGEAPSPAAVGRPELPEITGGSRHDGALRSPLDAPKGPGLPPIDASFDGMNNGDNVAAYGSAIIPPSPNVAVGLDHLLQGVNLLFRIYDKIGNPLTDPFKMSDLFQGTGGNCEQYDSGNPIVLYDPLAGRFVITAFSFLNPTTPPYSLCVAVSQTEDPTGEWSTYEYSTGNQFPAAPMSGVWTDAYWTTAAQFTNGTAFAGTALYAYERFKMLNGDPTATLQYFNLGTTHPTVVGCLPADLGGAPAPPPGTPQVISCPLPAAGLAVFQGHADFQDSSRSELFERPESPLTLLPYDPENPPGSDDIEQPPPATADAYLDSISYRLMHRFAYQTLPGGTQSYVLNFTVNVSGQTPTSAATYQAGIRWAELRRDPGTGTITVNQEGTIAEGPGNGNGVNLWNGSVAQDYAGNIFAAFSASGPFLNPSVWYTGHLATDPLGTMRIPGTAQAGGGVQTTTPSRWGDYSALVFDNADLCKLWAAFGYYQTTSSSDWNTRMFSFKEPSCTPPPRGTLNVTVFSGDTLNTYPVSITLDDGTFFEFSGGTHSRSLPVGHYYGRVGGYAGGAVVEFDIVENAVTNLEIHLGYTDEASSTYTVAVEQCQNNAADPGEQVTVSLCYTNEGGTPTADLAGVLYPNEGVPFTSGPRNFGVVTPGQEVCRDYEVTISSSLEPGSHILLNLQLSGGGSSFFVTYPLTAGVPDIELSQDFEGIVPPALPAGFVASGGPPSFQTTAASPIINNSLFIDNAPNQSDSFIQFPPVTVNSGKLYVAFASAANLEDGYDGAIVQVSTDGGATWKEWTEAGGTFESGGYNAIISPYGDSSLAGKPAWSGDFFDAILGTTMSSPHVAGTVAILRFHMATDSQGSGNPGGNPAGWWVDNIRIWDGAVACAPLENGLDVDSHAVFPSNSNLNTVLEPGEAVQVGAFLVNGTPNPISITGDATNFVGPAGGVYTFLDNFADYGSINGNLVESPQSTGDCFSATGDCYVMAVSDPAVRPAAHWDATFDETLSTGGDPKTWTLHIGKSFADVPTGNIFYRFIETIFHNSITGGCAAGTYCPANATLRKQMAVFVLKAVEGAAYVPPPATGVFNDVPVSDTFAPWIEELFRRGVVAGCATPGGPNYCPDNPVLRQQMAIFLLKTKFGSGYVPPPCQGIFGDIPCPSPFADWIEDLYNRAITGGCNVSPLLYCGTNPVTRGQMAVFLTKMFGLALYGP